MRLVQRGDVRARRSVIDVEIRYMILDGFGTNGQNGANAAATLSFAPNYNNLRNTGIHPLYGMDCLYGEVCGRAGFRST